MYPDENRSSSSNGSEKQTLQITPHISAHKTDIISSHNDNNVEMIMPTPMNHKIEVSSSAHSFISSNVSIMPSDVTLRSPNPTSSARVTSQDISNTHKFIGVPVEHVQGAKGLPNIQTILNPTIDSIVLSDKGQMLCKLADGTSLSLASMPTIIVSNLGTDGVVQNTVNVTNPTKEGTEAIPLKVVPTNQAILNSMPEIYPNSTETEILLSDFFDIKQVVWPEEHTKKEVKLEGSHIPSKDLIHEALQAAVSQNSSRASDGDFQEPNQECLVQDSVICHSAFSPQQIKNQDVYMMSPTNVGTQHGKIIGSQEITTAQLLVLQPAPSDSQVVSTDFSGSRRRPRLTEEASHARRERVANRMREKRANESEDQKIKRRIREAERMRKKRSQEDEIAKARRRHEAAERARKRRANLSEEERELERRKAAERMRLRRQKEDDEQKRVRRIKAAERMRRRRAMISPQDKAQRRQVCRRSKRAISEDVIKPEVQENFIYLPEVSCKTDNNHISMQMANDVRKRSPILDPSAVSLNLPVSTSTYTVLQSDHQASQSIYTGINVNDYHITAAQPRSLESDTIPITSVVTNASNFCKVEAEPHQSADRDPLYVEREANQKTVITTLPSVAHTHGS